MTNVWWSYGCSISLDKPSSTSNAIDPVIVHVLNIFGLLLLARFARTSLFESLLPVVTLHLPLKPLALALLLLFLLLLFLLFIT